MEGVLENGYSIPRTEAGTGSKVVDYVPSPFRFAGTFGGGYAKRNRRKKGIHKDEGRKRFETTRRKKEVLFPIQQGRRLSLGGEL